MSAATDKVTLLWEEARLQAIRDAIVGRAWERPTVEFPDLRADQQHTIRSLGEGVAIWPKNRRDAQVCVLSE